MAKTILLIEYEPRYLDRIKGYLAGKDFELVVAKDGEDGLEAYRRAKPDLVLISTVLPKLRTRDVIRGMQGLGATPPILLMASGYKGKDKKADAAREKDPTIVHRDFAAYQALYAAPFEPFPKTARELLRAGLIYARFTPTAAGLAARGTITTTDVHALIDQGLVAYEALRYEDFLPVSAAGIFASNLNQSGAPLTARVRPSYKQSDLEAILGRPIIDAAAVYASIHNASLLETYDRLGLTPMLSDAARTELQPAAQDRK